MADLEENQNAIDMINELNENSPPGNPITSEGNVHIDLLTQEEDQNAIDMINELNENSPPGMPLDGGDSLWDMGTDEPATDPADLNFDPNALPGPGMDLDEGGIKAGSIKQEFNDFATGVDESAPAPDVDPVVKPSLSEPSL